MPPAQVQELVAATKLWYETHDMLQRDLAAKLHVSPTGLCQIFAGVNQPSASTALAMIRFLEEHNMKTTTFIDPPKPPRQSAGTNPNFPRNLEEARSRIALLNQEIAQLKSAAPLPVKLGATVPAPTAKPTIATPAATQTPAPIKTGNIVENRGPAEKAPVAKGLPATADTPVLIQKILDVTNLDDLLLLLNNPAHTPTQQACIYAEVKKRRALVSNRFQ